MRERPIIFNADMVRAVLDGRKTQTRRIIRLDHERGMKNPVIRGKNGEASYVGCRLASTLCPFGAVGDRLWVRESFYEHGRWQGGGYDPEDSYFVSDTQVLYPADGIQRPAERKREDFWRSRPSIHMPRWASRMTLEITGVRVDRLWDITEDDAKAEGCTFEALRFKPGTREVEEMGHTAVYQFGGLWQTIYGDDSWQANPWVWVIEFKRVEVE